MSNQAQDPECYKLFQQLPVLSLRPFVRSFMVVEFPAFHRDAHLPSTGPVAAFSFGGACRIDRAVWAPPASFTTSWQTMRSHEHCHSHRVLLATFTPAGAACFLRASLEEMVSATVVDLAGVLRRPHELGLLEERLAQAADHEERIGMVEGFLLARIGVQAPDPLVTVAAAWLQNGAGSQRIDELARHVGLSQSALERRFRRVTGMPPKAFARVARLQRAAKLVMGGASFASAAHAAGYFDHSHFIRDFRQATNTSPGVYFRRKS